MEILSEKENKDGSVTFEMDFKEDEIQILLEYAVIHILKEYVERDKTKTKTKSKK
jgi:hypothetical protein